MTKTTNAEQELGSTTDGVVELKDDLQKTVDRGLEALRATMKEHPFVVLVAALGAGYLIARLVHR